MMTRWHPISSHVSTLLGNIMIGASCLHRSHEIKSPSSRSFLYVPIAAAADCITFSIDGTGREKERNGHLIIINKALLPFSLILSWCVLSPYLGTKKVITGTTTTWNKSWSFTLSELQNRALSRSLLKRKHEAKIDWNRKEMNGSNGIVSTRLSRRKIKNSRRHHKFRESQVYLLGSCANQNRFVCLRVMASVRITERQSLIPVTYDSWLNGRSRSWLIFKVSRLFRKQFLFYF